MVLQRDRMKIVIITFVPIKYMVIMSIICVLYCLSYIKIRVVLVRYSTLLDCDSFIRVDFLSLFACYSGAKHPRCPLNGIKKYLA